MTSTFAHFLKCYGYFGNYMGIFVPLLQLDEYFCTLTLLYLYLVSREVGQGVSCLLLPAVTNIRTKNLNDFGPNIRAHPTLSKHLLQNFQFYP